MILGFKQKFPWGKPTFFKEKILSGTKIHSIREDKNRRWKAGMLIHMAYGVRTKFYECFCNSYRCKSIQFIKINHYRGDFPEIEVIIDGDLKFKQMGMIWNGSGFIENLAKNDGFDSANDFFKWFDKDFEGVIIHWTDFCY